MNGLQSCTRVPGLRIGSDKERLRTPVDYVHAGGELLCCLGNGDTSRHCKVRCKWKEPSRGTISSCGPHEPPVGHMSLLQLHQ